MINFKAMLKSFLRPLFRSLWRRIEVRIEAKLTPIESRISTLEVGWRENIPAFLNAVSTVGAFGHELLRIRRDLEGQLHGLEGQLRGLEGQLDDRTAILRRQIDSVICELQPSILNAEEQCRGVWERIEFVRREILFEMRYRKPALGPLDSSLNPRILAPEKLVTGQVVALRLNLGCGHIVLDGYINVDQRELPGVDIVAEAGHLPIDEGSVQEIFSSHLLEHFPQEMLRRRLLPYWKSLLVPGGVFRCIVPDGEAMLAGLSAGTYPFEDFREVLFGAQEYEGDFHFNMLTPASLSSLLHEAGFRDISLSVRGRPNGKCFEFEVACIKLIQ